MRLARWGAQIDRTRNKCVHGFKDGGTERKKQAAEHTAIQEIV
ncbi:MAG: hypothetical protein ACJAXR_001221 [Halopseudomonas sp.]|jgi:hypothetical protein